MRCSRVLFSMVACLSVTAGATAAERPPSRTSKVAIVVKVEPASEATLSRGGRFTLAVPAPRGRGNRPRIPYEVSTNIPVVLLVVDEMTGERIVAESPGVARRIGGAGGGGDPRRRPEAIGYDVAFHPDDGTASTEQAREIRLEPGTSRGEISIMAIAPNSVQGAYMGSLAVRLTESAE